MSYYSKERNENFMGNPSSNEKIKGKKADPFFSAGASKGKILKGMEAHDPDSFPADPSGRGFKNQRSSEIKKGSI